MSGSSGSHAKLALAGATGYKCNGYICVCFVCEVVVQLATANSHSFRALTLIAAFMDHRSRAVYHSVTLFLSCSHSGLRNMGPAVH